VTALAENGSNNFGLVNYSGARAILRGGSFTGRGGSQTCGIHNADGTTTLEAESVIALGENGGSNYGLRNVSAAAATLRGGSFTARGGGYNCGINNENNGTTLDAISVTALGENGSNLNYGLNNYTGAAAILHDSSFTGRGGESAYGIYNYGASSTLEAESITALGENGSSFNMGLSGSATANVTQSVLEGATYSIYKSGGSITVSNSRLAGGTAAGSVTCVLVTRGTTVSTDGSTCP
jgi:hypothetical protein